MNKVDGPNVVGMCGPQPDDGAVFVIKPLVLLMLKQWLQTLFTPQALDLLMVNTPAFHAQRGCDFPITIPPILLGQPDHRQAKFVVICGFGLIAQT